MPKEPDNPVSKMLREIRAIVETHDKRFDKIDKRFDQIDKTLEEMQESLTFALGTSMHANVRHESVKKELEDIKKRLKRLEQRP
jgi:chromosome segregation ATPase